MSTGATRTIESTGSTCAHAGAIGGIMLKTGGLFFVLCYEPESGKAELATSRAFLFYENAQAYASTLNSSLAPFIVKKVAQSGNDASN